jgi:hypothetical protein
MSRYISSGPEEDAVRASCHDDSKFIGDSDGDRETKWMGWRVLLVDGRIYACVTDPEGGFCCAEEITSDELGMYVKGAAARERLESMRRVEAP